MYELFGGGSDTLSCGIFLEEAALDYVVSPGPKPQSSFALVDVDAAGERRWMGYLKDALPYLSEKTGMLAPQGLANRARVHRYINIKDFAVYDEEAGGRGGPRINSLIFDFEKGFADSEYLCGPYSYADIWLYPHLARSERNLPAGSYPNIRRWLDTMALRPPVGRGMSVVSRRG